MFLSLLLVAVDYSGAGLRERWMAWSGGMGWLVMKLVGCWSNIEPVFEKLEVT